MRWVLAAESRQLRYGQLARVRARGMLTRERPL